MHTVFNKETRFTTNFNTNNMAPIIKNKKNIVFEILDDDNETEIIDEILEQKIDNELPTNRLKI